MVAALPSGRGVDDAIHRASAHFAVGTRGTAISFGFAVVLAVGIVVTLRGQFGLRVLRFVSLVPVVLAVAAVLRLALRSGCRRSPRALCLRKSTAWTTGLLPLAILRLPRETEYGLQFYRNQSIPRYELGQIPEGNICWWREKDGRKTSQNGPPDVGSRIWEASRHRVWIITGWQGRAGINMRQLAISTQHSAFSQSQPLTDWNKMPCVQIRCECHMPRPCKTLLG